MRNVEAEDGELEEVNGLGRAGKLNRTWTHADKTVFLGELLHYAMAHEYKKGWAVHKYEERLGVKPWAVWGAAPVAPSLETLAWIRSRAIAWAKSQPKERGW